MDYCEPDPARRILLLTVRFMLWNSHALKLLGLLDYGRAIADSRNYSPAGLAVPHGAMARAPARLDFITTIPQDVYRGSGCFVGIQTLAKALAQLNCDVAMITPDLHLPVLALERLSSTNICDGGHSGRAQSPSALTRTLTP